MAADKSNQIIGATVQVDTKGAQSNVKGLKKDLADVKGELKATGAAAAGAGKDIGGATTHFSNIKNQLSTMPGALGSAASGVGTLSSAFRALLANPIGLVLTAIVGTLTLLYKAFTNTFEGGEKVEQIFAGIKAVGQSLLDNLGKIGGAIVKLLKLDFSGAYDDIKGVTLSAGQAYNQMAKLTAESQKLAREQADNDLDQAKRQAKLAELRAKAEDPSVSAAARIKAGKELLAESEANAKADIDLAARVSENKIKQLTQQQDGERKNHAEIQKIKAEQVNVETQNSNEIKRIRKQITAAEQEELTKQKEARQKAIEEEKQDRQRLNEFTQQLAALKADNQLRAIKDEAERDRQAIENKIESEKQGIARQLQEKKITNAQFDQLNAELEKSAALQREALTDKQNQEKAKKEADFQKEINDLTNKLKLSGITDARQAEKLQLEIEAEQKLKEAAERYKTDQTKFLAEKALIDAQLAQDQAKLDKKNKKEDLDKALKPSDDIGENDFDAKREALDANLLLLKDHYDKKIITEQEYNTKHKQLTDERINVNEAEINARVKAFRIISQGIDAVGGLFGKQTAAAKAAAIASTIINTYAAAWAIFRNATANPKSILFPAQPYIEAGTAIVAGLKNVAQIVKVPAPGGGGSAGIGGGAPSAPISTAAPVAPIAQSTKIIQSGDEPKPAPVRAYVMHQDNAAAVEREIRLKGPAVLGGYNL
jgi:hypothetical protein